MTGDLPNNFSNLAVALEVVSVERRAARQTKPGYLVGGSQIWWYW